MERRGACPGDQTKRADTALYRAGVDHHARGHAGRLALRRPAAAVPKQGCHRRTGARSPIYRSPLEKPCPVLAAGKTAPHSRSAAKRFAIRCVTERMAALALPVEHPQIGQTGTGGTFIHRQRQGQLMVRPGATGLDDAPVGKVLGPRRACAAAGVISSAASDQGNQGFHGASLEVGSSAASPVSASCLGGRGAK